MIETLPQTTPAPALIEVLPPIDSYTPSLEVAPVDPSTLTTSLVSEIENGNSPVLADVEKLDAAGREKVIDALIKNPALTESMDNQVQEQISLTPTAELKDGLTLMEERQSIQEVSVDLMNTELSDTEFINKYGQPREVVETDLMNYNKALEITVLQREFLSINPKAEIVDEEKGVYAIALEDGSKIYGSIYSVIDGHKDLVRMRGVANTIKSGISISIMGLASTEGATYNSVVVASGSFAQREINPYPADMDFAEHLNIKAGDMELAGNLLASLLTETVTRTTATKGMQFTEMKCGRYPDGVAAEFKGKQIKWTQNEIMAGTKTFATEDGKEAAITLEQACANPDKIKLDWLTVTEAGEVKELTKVINLEVTSEEGVELFNNRQASSAFQEIYFDDISDFGLTERLREPAVITDYLNFLRKDVAHYSEQGNENFMKVAKRSYNLMKVSGDIEGARSLAPLFDSAASEMGARSESLELLGDYMDAAKTKGETFDAATFTNSIDKVTELVTSTSGMFEPTESATLSQKLEALKSTLATDPEQAHKLIVELTSVFSDKVNVAAAKYLSTNKHFQSLVAA